MDELGQRVPDDPGPALAAEQSIAHPHTSPVSGSGASIYRDLRQVFSIIAPQPLPMTIHAGNHERKRHFVATITDPDTIALTQSNGTRNWTVLANGALEVHIDGVQVDIGQLSDAVRGQVHAVVATLGISREEAVQLLVEMADGAVHINEKARSPKYRRA